MPKQLLGLSKSEITALWALAKDHPGIAARSVVEHAKTCVAFGMPLVVAERQAAEIAERIRPSTPVDTMRSLPAIAPETLTRTAESKLREKLARICDKAGRPDLARRVRSQADGRRLTVDDEVDFEADIENPRGETAEVAGVRIAARLLGGA